MVPPCALQPRFWGGTHPPGHRTRFGAEARLVSPARSVAANSLFAPLRHQKRHPTPNAKRKAKGPERKLRPAPSTTS